MNLSQSIENQKEDLILQIVTLQSIEDRNKRFAGTITSPINCSVSEVAKSQMYSARKKKRRLIEKLEILNEMSDETNFTNLA